MEQIELVDYPILGHGEGIADILCVHLNGVKVTQRKCFV